MHERNKHHEISPVIRVLGIAALTAAVLGPSAYAATGNTPAQQQQHAEQALEFIGLELATGFGAVGSKTLFDAGAQALHPRR